ncbi:MAG: hypothetical protein MJ175_04130 [Clostridia bacterium]|nr:hypothetical protein [Clostridia bacterium]
MTNNFKRTCVLLLLACASASCVMTACGDSGNTPAVTGAAPSGNNTQAVTEAVTEAAPLYDDKLPETDMGGF